MSGSLSESGSGNPPPPHSIRSLHPPRPKLLIASSTSTSTSTLIAGPGRKRTRSPLLVPQGWGEWPHEPPLPPRWGETPHEPPRPPSYSYSYSARRAVLVLERPIPNAEGVAADSPGSAEERGLPGVRVPNEIRTLKGCEGFPRCRGRYRNRHRGTLRRRIRSAASSSPPPPKLLIASNRSTSTSTLIDGPRRKHTRSPLLVPLRWGECPHEPPLPPRWGETPSSRPVPLRTRTRTQPAGRYSYSNAPSPTPTALQPIAPGRPRNEAYPGSMSQMKPAP